MSTKTDMRQKDTLWTQPTQGVRDIMAQTEAVRPDLKRSLYRARFYFLPKAETLLTNRGVDWSRSVDL